MRFEFKNIDVSAFQDTEDVVWRDTDYWTVINYLAAFLNSGQPSAEIDANAPQVTVSSIRPEILFRFG